MARKNVPVDSAGASQLTTRRTVVLMLLCGIVAFIVLIVQLAGIMIGQHDSYESAAVSNQVRTTTVTAARGTIYDSNMNILAQSATAETVIISPAELVKYCEDKTAVTAFLSETLGLDYDTLLHRWDDTSSWYRIIARRVELETANKIRAYIYGGFKDDPNYTDLSEKKEVTERGYLNCVHLEEDSKRYYPYGSSASQIIGFVGTENTGLEGLEAVYNDTLSGKSGRIVRTVTGRNDDVLFTGYENYYDSSDGSSLVLTINNTVQHYLKKHIEQAIADNMIRSGGIGIVMNVKTGALLGCVSVPDFDLNDYSTLNDTFKAQLEAEWAEGMTVEEYDTRYVELLQQQWRNRAIADTYEPGSTFKIITLASALDDGVVSTEDHFYCSGSTMIMGRTDPLHCWKDAGHRDQTLAQSAQNSCNVAFSSMGIRLGASRFYDYMEAFGFFDKTGIDLYGEASSIWWSRSVFENPYNHSQLAAASFGQTFNITPIQNITAICAAVNGGYLMKPYVVQQVLDGDGNVIRNTTPTVVRQVISEETSAVVRDIIESVVSSPTGTGKNASVAGYSVGGKTGTSEKVGQASDEYMVSFIGVAPMEDPQVAVLVILDSPDPSSGIYISGGGMVAPYVGNILSDILPYLGVEESSGAKINVNVPNVRSGSVAEAKAELEKQGFGVKVVGTGDTVTDQAPKGNLKVAAGTTVILYAGTEKPDNMVTVPDMVGKTYKAAKQYFEAFGLFVKLAGVTPTDSNTIVVQRQSVAPGETVSFGSVVEIGLIDNDETIMETIA